jgi:hypothetical protein
MLPVPNLSNGGFDHLLINGQIFVYGTVTPAVTASYDTPINTKSAAYNDDYTVTTIVNARPAHNTDINSLSTFTLQDRNDGLVKDYRAGTLQNGSANPIALPTIVSASCSWTIDKAP